MTIRRVFPALLAALLLLPACGDVAARLRRHTYPPGFKYIEHDQLQSAMWQLAAEVRELDARMRLPGPIDPARRVEIRRLLDAMVVATDDLQTQGRPTNHPLMSDHLATFRRDLTLARNGVDAEPPNYYLVGTISGACLTCHAPER